MRPGLRESRAPEARPTEGKNGTKGDKTKCLFNPTKYAPAALRTQTSPFHIPPLFLSSLLPALSYPYLQSTTPHPHQAATSQTPSPASPTRKPHRDRTPPAAPHPRDPACPGRSRTPGTSAPCARRARPFRNSACGTASPRERSRLWGLCRHRWWRWWRRKRRG